LIGAWLGPVAAPAAVLTYLAAGAACPALLAHPLGLAGPTGGYLIGFVPAAAVAGWLLGGRRALSGPQALAALIAADAVIFAAGLAWLWAGGFVPSKLLLSFGLIPFLPGEMVKVAAAAVVLRRWMA
jgi:biotin transport system substrate-specific component